MADCPPHILRRLLQGHRGDTWPAGLGLRAGKALRSEARLQAGHATRQTSVLSVLEADGRGQVSRSSGEDPACLLPRLWAPDCTAPISASSPRAASLVCLRPNLLEDTSHCISLAPL